VAERLQPGVPFAQVELVTTRTQAGKDLDGVRPACTCPQAPKMMVLAEELIPTIMLNTPMPDSKSILDLLLMGKMHLTINSTVRASMTKAINGMRP